MMTTFAAHGIVPTKGGKRMSLNLDEKKRWWQSIRLPKRKAGEKFRVNWLLLALGIISVAIAAVLEHPVLAAKTPHVLSAGEFSGQSVVFSWKALIGFLKEIGFALIIAWAVSYLIERQAKKRDHEANEAARKQMASDVIFAVYGLQHSRDYVRKVVEKTLLPKVVRTRYSVGYTIERLSAEEQADLQVTSTRFVKFSQISTYSFLNVSPDPVTHEIRYALPVRNGERLHDFAGIRSAKIGDQICTRAQLEGALNSKREDAYKAYSWSRTLKPGVPLAVVIEAVSIKELSDNEVWGNYHATYEGMTLTVRNLVPEITAFGLRELTASSAAKVYENPGRDAQWTINGPILPNDSVVFWWRSKADDGMSKPDVPAAPGKRKVRVKSQQA